jgi:hypothetical protein
MSGAGDNDEDREPAPFIRMSAEETFDGQERVMSRAAYDLQAGRIAQAFRPPLRFAQVHTAGFYDDAGFCQDCDAPYCYRHWHVSETGYGYCPRGHGKSLDLHW